MKKLEKKTVAEARREKAAMAANDLVAEDSEKKKKSQLNSPKTAKGGTEKSGFVYQTGRDTEYISKPGFSRRRMGKPSRSSLKNRSTKIGGQFPRKESIKTVKNIQSSTGMK